MTRWGSARNTSSHSISTPLSMAFSNCTLPILLTLLAIPLVASPASSPPERGRPHETDGPRLSERRSAERAELLADLASESGGVTAWSRTASWTDRAGEPLSESARLKLLTRHALFLRDQGHHAEAGRLADAILDRLDQVEARAGTGDLARAEAARLRAALLAGFERNVRAARRERMRAATLDPEREERQRQALADALARGLGGDGAPVKQEDRP